MQVPTTAPPPSSEERPTAVLAPSVAPSTAAPAACISLSASAPPPRRPTHSSESSTAPALRAAVAAPAPPSRIESARACKASIHNGPKSSCRRRSPHRPAARLVGLSPFAVIVETSESAKRTCGERRRSEHLHALRCEDLGESEAYEERRLHSSRRRSAHHGGACIEHASGGVAQPMRRGRTAQHVGAAQRGREPREAASTHEHCAIGAHTVRDELRDHEELG